MSPSVPGEPDRKVWTARMSELTESERRAVASYLTSTDRARAVLGFELDTLKQRRDRIGGMQNDRTVLVRNTQGPALKTYHADDRPCGRVTGQARSLASFDVVLEGEAKQRHLTRCSACRWS